MCLTLVNLVSLDLFSLSLTLADLILTPLYGCCLLRDMILNKYLLLI